MKVLRTIVLGTMLTMCAFSRASAQDAATLAAARELTVIVSVGVLGDLAAKQEREIWPTVEAAFRQQYPNIDSPTLLELRAEFERVQNTALRLAMEDAPAIYARLLTAQEIRELIAFYRTPTGMKTLKVMPQATNELLAAMIPRIQEGAERVRLSMIDILRKRGYER